jgi:uncharacterized protein YndB with AHSA1/START domain
MNVPVKRDSSGRRYVAAETEVPGSPEEVWQAIASGPGISAWFVPTEVDGRVGGVTTSNFGPGMDSVSTITAWEPPHRFVAESRDDMGPEDPTVATEWSVEARSGGTCVVRVVHSWFTSKDDWDEQFEGHSYGWLAFFRILRLYLAHFSGQPSAALQLMGVAPEPKEEAWDAFMRSLGISGAAPGERVRTSGDTPPLAGVVEWAGQPAWPEELLVRLDEPAPGIAHLVPHPMGGQVYLTMRVFLYGDQADAAVGRDEPRWQAWMNAHFPMVAEVSTAD